MYVSGYVGMYVYACGCVIGHNVCVCTYGYGYAHGGSAWVYVCVWVCVGRQVRIM